MKFKLVMVEWEDSRQPSPTWKHEDACLEWSAVKCASVGWLVSSDKERKVLAPNIGDINDENNTQFSGEIVIPTRCVLSIKNLQ